MKFKRHTINVAGLGRLPAFSHAVRAGDLLFVSGTLGTLGDALKLAEGGAGPETRQALKNIGKILAEAGANFDNVVNAKVFMVDMSQFQAMNDAYISFFPVDPPSRITVGCNELALGAAVEIEIVAHVPKLR